MAKRFELETNLESTMSVACTSPDVPAEDHRVSSEELAPDHLLDVAGLLAEVWYDCTATTVGADGTAVLDFATQVGPIPFPAPLIEVWTAPGGTISDAYTALNYFQTGNNTKRRLMVVDPDGSARWYWEVPDEVGTPPLPFSRSIRPRTPWCTGCSSPLPTTRSTARSGSVGASCSTMRRTALRCEHVHGMGVLSS